MVWSVERPAIECVLDTERISYKGAKYDVLTLPYPEDGTWLPGAMLIVETNKGLLRIPSGTRVSIVPADVPSTV